MGVPSLNSATFGKLVHFVFGNLQTRRLGRRGESKYNYVDFDVDDQEIGIKLPGQEERERRETSELMARPGTAGGQRGQENFFPNNNKSVSLPTLPCRWRLAA